MGKLCEAKLQLNASTEMTMRQCVKRDDVGSVRRELQTYYKTAELHDVGITNPETAYATLRVRELRAADHVEAVRVAGTAVTVVLAFSTFAALVIANVFSLGKNRPESVVGQARILLTIIAIMAVVYLCGIYRSSRQNKGRIACRVALEIIAKREEKDLQEAPTPIVVCQPSRQPRWRSFWRST